MARWIFPLAAALGVWLAGSAQAQQQYPYVPAPQYPGQVIRVQAQGQPEPVGMPNVAGPAMQDPVPVYQPNLAAPYDNFPPKLPPYAWPTYAPYNNYSRVAYPEAYPYNAWPFIGPFYPFPKVPLGWRSVKIEWEDGHWYIGRKATPHDWWRIRYW